jgi:hypothetical protein
LSGGNSDPDNKTNQIDQINEIDHSPVSRGRRPDNPEYFAAVQAGLDRNYEPMTKLFTVVIERTLQIHGT